MKKLLTVFVLAMFTLTTLAASGAKEAQGDLSLEKIMDRGSFVLGLDDAFPPMGFRDENNEIVGYDIDLAKEVFSRMGVDLILQPIDWSSKEQELATGNIDCIWNGFTITPEREEVILFTDPYLKNQQILVVKADSSYQSIVDVKGKVVGLQGGSSASDAMDSSPEFKDSLEEIIEFSDNLTALMDLEAGGVDAVLLDLFVANDNIQRSGKNFRILSGSLTEENYGIGFRKDDVALRDKVQAVLKDMAADGTIAAISTKWFGADISTVSEN
ncbi:MAG: amino acid ABC transporter substrate-binding protein [Sphaerochaetaceae bacterium]|nr:amino acid ABC transporter substrate-binding protein [Sphaerochaetaceae bacterium]